MTVVESLAKVITEDEAQALRAEFPPNQVGKLPRVNTELDYVGHGAVTSRLLEVDPEWSWEPVAYDERGLPCFDRNEAGDPVGLWIRLTVCGVTRLGYGDVAANAFHAEKQLIGDAIRNAAMRFGVALDLWIKGQAEDDERRAESDTRTRSSRRSSGVPTCARCGKSLAGASVVVVDGERVHKDGCPGSAEDYKPGEEPFE